MSSIRIAAAVAGMLALSTPMAFAAEPAATAPIGSTHGSITSNRIEPGQLRATDLKGSTVYGNDDQSIASVKDLVLDRSGRVAAVVLDVDGKYVAVAMKDLKITTNKDNKPRVAVAMTKAELKSAQAFDLGSGAAASGSSTPPATIPSGGGRNR